MPKFSQLPILATKFWHVPKFPYTCPGKKIVLFNHEDLTAVCSFYRDQQFIDVDRYDRVVVSNLTISYKSHRIEEYCDMADRYIEYSLIDRMIQNDQMILNNRLSVEIVRNDHNIEQFHKILPLETQQLFDEILEILNRNKSNHMITVT